MTEMMSKYYLFSNPSFLSGMGRVLDLGSTLNEYNSMPHEGIADYFAVQSDWRAVGDDIWSAISEYGKKKEK